MTDEEIYERTVEELPFTAEEELARAIYWRRCSDRERMQAAHEILRRHWQKRGIDIDSIRMDKSVVNIVKRQPVTTTR
ncbi:MAG TPA: hypothetical protein VGU23_06700 [Acidobacteriaceae bacterium]|nr:hypothetical protein [Acidobacteriaceae bacterium]